MRRIKENGWDKFNEIQSDFFNLIEAAKNLPDDNIVFFLSHIETKDDGRQKIKTIGKMLDEKITIEGMFTVVLKTFVSDGKYYFITQNSGMDTVKSPIGMFPSVTIDNDLKYVAEKIKNYYYMDGAKSDAEMQKEDDAVKADVDPNEKKSRRRRRNEPESVAVTVDNGKGEETYDVPVVDEAAPKQEEAAPKTRRRKNRQAEIADDEIPF